MSADSHIVVVSAAVRKKIRLMSSHVLSRARGAITPSNSAAHGSRLRYGARLPGLQASLAEVLLDSHGEIAEASCGVCPASMGYGSWAHGCLHTAGLVACLLDGELVVGDDPEQHALLSKSEGQLQYWLRRNHAVELLEASAAELCRRYDSRAFSAPGTVGEVLSSEGAPGWSALQRQTLAEVVEQEVQIRKRASAGAPWRLKRPEDPAHAAFFDSVHRELARRGAHAAALLAPGVNHGGRLTIDEAPLQVRWVSNERQCVTTGGKVRHCLTYDSTGVHIHTETGSRVLDSCPYAIDLLHIALDYLNERFTKAGKQRLSRALKLSPWEQQVLGLDHILDELGVSPVPAEPSSEPKGNKQGELLGWQVYRRDNRQWSLRAVWTQPYVRRTGLKVRDFSPTELQQQQDRFSRQDRAIAQQLDTIWSAMHCTDPAVFRVAAGHPRMIDEQRELFPYRPGELGLRLDPDEDEGLRLSFVDSTTGRSLSQGQVEAVLQDSGQGLIAFDRTTRPATFFPFSRASLRLVSGLANRSPVFPAAARGAFLRRVPALRQVLPIVLHPSLVGEAREPDLRPVLRLAPLAEGPIEVQCRVRPLPGGPLVPPGEGPEELESVVDEQRVYTTRDLPAERAAVVELLGEDADLIEDGADVHLPLSDDTLSRLQRLQQRAEDGELLLEWTRDAMRVTRTASAPDIHVSVGGGKDWLGLGGELQVDGHSLDIQRVMEAVRSGRRFVKLDGENWVGLSDQLRERMARLAARVRIDKRGRSSIAPMSGEELDALAAEGASVDVPETLKVETHRLREARSITFLRPRGLQATLRPYQAEGLQWLQRLAHWSPGACLADDMGLGKTLQALGLLLHRASDGPALVVAPTSLASNWIAEAARFAPELSFHSYRGTKREELLGSLGPGSVLVTSYDIMRRDVKKLVKADFHTVVYDEAQAFKNPTSQTARAAATLRGRFCLALSGTPVENRSEELWSLFRVLVPGLLGSREWFRSEIALPADNGDARARGRLSALVAPFLLRRTKQQVANDLPERSEIIQRVTLTRAERRLYDAARLAGLQLREEDPRKARFAVLKALTRLRQLACDPRLVDPRSRVASSKLAALQELVDGIVHQGAQVLIFSQWTSLLDRVESTLAAHRCIRLDGSTPQKKRSKLVDSFQGGEADVFLISRQAGGTGLNLTAATYVIHLDPWWNPAAEDQATDRAHRIGQSSKVTVYRLIAEGTVEEGVLEMQDAKRELVDSILEGSRSRRTPTVQELLALIQGG